MNNTKLSKLLIGSALVLGLGASTGSFAQARAAQQMIIGESSIALIQGSQELQSVASQIVGGTFAGTAAQMALLQSAINGNSAIGSTFASKLKTAEVTAQPAFFGTSLQARSKLNGIRAGVAALVLAAGLSQADAQTAETGITSAVGKAVAGRTMEECLTKWSDSNAKNVAATVLVDMGKATTVASFQDMAVKDSMKSFPGESYAQVQQRLAESMNSASCDIARVRGLRPARM